MYKNIYINKIYKQLSDDLIDKILQNFFSEDKKKLINSLLKN